MFDRPQDDHNKGRAGVDIGAMIGEMDANGVQGSYYQVDFT